MSGWLVALIVVGSVFTYVGIGVAFGRAFAEQARERNRAYNLGHYEILYRDEEGKRRLESEANSAALAWGTACTFLWPAVLPVLLTIWQRPTAPAPDEWLTPEDKRWLTEHTPGSTP